MSHVTDIVYEDGHKLDKHIMFCGARLCPTTEWAFVDAGHVLSALHQGTAITPCRDCLAVMMSLISTEMQSGCGA